MSGKDAFSAPVPNITKYVLRYVKEVLHEPTDELRRNAEALYAKMYAETPPIGGKANPMADNLYEFMTFCAYYEASGHRIGEDSIPFLRDCMMKDHSYLGKLVNLNHRFPAWLMDRLFGSITRKTAKKNATGAWGSTWRIAANPQGHTEGVSYVLYGCPLLAFAKAHGYEAIMPKFCAIDHASAALMHARLIRFETEATGGSCCDYWFVGDQSETAKKYADLPKI